MLSRLRQRRLGMRLASVLLLACLLAPAVPRALVTASNAGAGWVELCTAQGMRWLRVAADGSPANPGDPAGTHFGQCLWCFGAGDGFEVEPTTFELVRTAVADRGAAVIAVAAPTAAPSLRLAQPRAPPRVG